MELYVVRHGQTENNAQKRMIGRTMVYGLTEKGKQQALEASEQLKNVEYDMVVCSPLLRAKITCEIVNTAKKPVIYDDRLMERDSGEMEGKTKEGFDYEHYWNWNYTFDIKGMTPIKDFVRNIWDCLDELEQKYPDKKLLIVTHNGVCRAIGAYFCGIPEDGNLTIYAHKNCQIKHYRKERSSVKR